MLATKTTINAILATCKYDAELYYARGYSYNKATKLLRAMIDKTDVLLSEDALADIVDDTVARVAREDKTCLRTSW